MSDLHEDYSAAGFGGEIGFGDRPAVILIDAAKAYIEPDAPLYVGSEDAFQAMIALAKTARDNNVPVIFTRVEFMPGGADGGLFYQKVQALSLFQTGQPLADFDDRLQPLENEIIVTKQYPSAFFGTSLASTLNAMRVDSCLLAGFSTSGCVRASTLDALQYGFRPIVVTDACGDRDPQVQSANLFDLEQKYADLKNLSEVEAYLTALTRS
ncbi:MAG: isochorismatase family protein [Parasphingorhabdus sp.]|uniref:isochorismatase family protein n=1 Tax=Parasphingorhabdus sp. TaxID=2709688 RepID=UPI00329A3176